MPKQVVSDALRSATKGRAFIVHVDSVKKMHAVGYVTKYLTKDITVEKRGMREELREIIVHRLDDQGNIVQECSMQTVQILSKAKRIRYTRQFFPASTADLRLRLFSDLGDVQELAIDQAAVPDMSLAEEKTSQVHEDEQMGTQSSSWVLHEHDAFSRDINEYRARKQIALAESMEQLRAGKFMYSGRVVSIWSYQRRRRSEDKTHG